MYAGLVGGLVIGRKGAFGPDLVPTDVDRSARGQACLPSHLRACLTGSPHDSQQLLCRLAMTLPLHQAY